MSESALESDLAWLSGRKFALVGKLGGVTKRQGVRLVRELGGTIVDDPAGADVIVIGAEEPRDAREKLLDNATRALAASGAIEVLHETDFWQRLGLVESQQDVRRLYTPALLAELVGVSVSTIRRWHKRGLIEPAREVHRLPYFDFAEVAIARRLAEMTSAGASTASIERTVAELQRHAPHLARPLAELPTLVEGKQLLLWHDDGLIEPSGQRRFDFSTEDGLPSPSSNVDGRGSPSYEKREPAPHTPEQLVALAGELDEAGELRAAAETYRAALAAGGPSAETCFLLAELLYRTGDLSAARERYLMAIELDEDFVEARANLGCVLAEQGERDLALAALAGALAFHPDYADAHYHRARLLDDAGRHAEAAGHWARFRELAPDSPWEASEAGSE